MPVENASDKWTAVFEGGASAPSIAIAQAAADAAEGFAIDASGSASTATAQAGIAATIKNDILAISGVKGVFDTKSAANAGLSGLANGTLVLVKADETKSGASWHYQVSGGAFVDKGAAITNGPITVPRNVTPATSSSTTIFEVIPDEPLTNSAGGNDAVVSAMRQTTNYLTQGPTGHANYYNSVIGLGLNINDSFAPLNAAQAAASSRIEFKFAQGNPSSNFGAEYHMASLIAVGNFEFRAYTAFIAHNKDKWHLSADGTAVMQAAYQHVFADGRNIARIQCEFSDTTARMYWTKGNQVGSCAPQIFYAENNRAPITLINAAGTAYVEAFKLTSGDRMLFSNPETRQMAQSTGILGFGTVNAETQFLSPAGGSIGQVVTWQNVTGDFTPVVYHGSVSGNAMLIARNTGSGGKIGQIIAANNGAAYLGFEDANAGSAGFQIRQPAGAATLEIDAGYRGAVGAVIMAKFHRTSGMAEFPNGALLGLKTVGTLPTPTTGDKGRSFFCTNARNAGEGPGAGTGSIVACNGSAYTIPGIAGAVAA